MLFFFANSSLVNFLALFLYFLLIGASGGFECGNFARVFSLVLVFIRAPFLVLCFSYYTLLTFLIPSTLSLVLVSFDHSNNWRYWYQDEMMSLFLMKKLSFKKLGLSLFSKLDWSFSLSLLWKLFLKNGGFVCFRKVLSSKLFCLR